MAIVLNNVDKIISSTNSEFGVPEISSPAEGQILAYESGKWVNKPLPDGGIPEMTRDDSDPTYTDYIFG